MTLTAKDAAALIGKRGTYQPAGAHGPGLTFMVKIIDARLNFGRIDVLIAPVMGSGAAWVSLESVQLATQLDIKGVK